MDDVGLFLTYYILFLINVFITINVNWLIQIEKQNMKFSLKKKHDGSYLSAIMQGVQAHTRPSILSVEIQTDRDKFVENFQANIRLQGTQRSYYVV